ncbi:MAG: flagellar motor switch protein FliN [Alphaproteobacteria bacterium]
MNADNDKLDLDELTGADRPAGDGVEMAADAFLAADLASSAIDDGSEPPNALGAIYDVPVQVSAVLGKTSMPISQLIKLGRGAVLELDRKVGESIDVVVNNRLIAKGEIVIVEERIGITMTEIIKTDGQ